jgi:hypothetical protein
MDRPLHSYRIWGSIKRNQRQGHDNEVVPIRFRRELVPRAHPSHHLLAGLAERTP